MTNLGKVTVRTRHRHTTRCLRSNPSALPASANSSTDATDRPGVGWALRPNQGGGEGARSPNPLFLCGSYRTALAGGHRLASSLVRPRMDTNRLRSPSVARPESVGSSFKSPQKTAGFAASCPVPRAIARLVAGRGKYRVEGNSSGHGLRGSGVERVCGCR
jgi:hypothetical protein